MSCAVTDARQAQHNEGKLQVVIETVTRVLLRRRRVFQIQSRVLLHMQNTGLQAKPRLIPQQASSRMTVD